MHLLLFSSSIFCLPPLQGLILRVTAYCTFTLFLFVFFSFFVTTHQEHGVFEWRLASRGSLDTGILEKRGGIMFCLEIDDRVCI